jgi:DNA-binding IclR family transcriptional regulator
MNRNAAPLLAPLGPEAEAVLAVLASSGSESSVKLNALVAATGLPMGHVGRHLRTLERDRFARYASGSWLVTPHGARRALDIDSSLLPVAA